MSDKYKDLRAEANRNIRRLLKDNHPDVNGNRRAPGITRFLITALRLVNCKGQGVSRKEFCEWRKDLDE